MTAKAKVVHGSTDSFEVRMAKAKSFLEETDRQEIQNDIVHIKTLHVPILDKSSFDGKLAQSTKELVFTFFYRVRLRSNNLEKRSGKNELSHHHHGSFGFILSFYIC